MALYRFAAGVIARSKGHSSTAAAAYRAGERITDERTGQTHDYSRRTGVLWSGIYAPKNAPEWMQDRAQLWNGAEKAEKRKDAQTAREFIVCLPHELNLEQGRRLVGDFLRENFARKGFVADVAIHAPGKGGDERNTHAHFLVTMRQVDGRGFAANKDRTQNEKTTLQTWRENWAKLGNRHLERAGHAGTLDHRSYADQGIDRTGGEHIGKSVRNMERRGIPTEAGERQRAREQTRQEIDKIRAELARLEAVPDRPTVVPEPANDPGRPEARPVNDNGAERRGKVEPPILKVTPPTGPDLSKPIELVPVAARTEPIVQAPGHAKQLPPKPTADHPKQIAAIVPEQVSAGHCEPVTPEQGNYNSNEALTKAEDRLSPVQQVSPHTFYALETLVAVPAILSLKANASASGELPSSIETLSVQDRRPVETSALKTAATTVDDRLPPATFIRTLLTVAAGWTQRVFGKPRVAANRPRHTFQEPPTPAIVPKQEAPPIAPVKSYKERFNERAAERAILVPLQPPQPLVQVADPEREKPEGGRSPSVPMPPMGGRRMTQSELEGLLNRLARFVQHR